MLMNRLTVIDLHYIYYAMSYTFILYGKVEQPQNFILFVVTDSYESRFSFKSHPPQTNSILLFNLNVNIYEIVFIVEECVCSIYAL